MTTRFVLSTRYSHWQGGRGAVESLLALTSRQASRSGPMREAEQASNRSDLLDDHAYERVEKRTNAAVERLLPHHRLVKAWPLRLGLKIQMLQTLVLRRRRSTVLRMQGSARHSTLPPRRASVTSWATSRSTAFASLAR